jgi:sugar lactone lactonase YvrE
MPRVSFATCPDPVLPDTAASVFFDGLFTSPRLQHPEGIAIGPDGWIWCGSENGQLLRIAPDASRIEEVASTGGFTLGLAFDGAGHLFACDLKHAAVFRLRLGTGALERFTQPGIKVPNYPAVDRRRNRLLVSDSHAFGQDGPGIWSFDLSTGAGGLWWDRPMTFANGIALTHDADAVLVCETFARRIVRIAIQADGTAGAITTVADDLPGLPDGLALDRHGTLFCACYEPSRILRIGADGRAVVYVEDPTAHILAHPTNIAFNGSDLLTSNLGRWHLTRIASDTSADPLWQTL